MTEKEIVFAVPISIAQETFLGSTNGQPESSPLCRCFNLRGELNFAALEQSFNELARRHEILRTTFPSNGTTRVQLINPVASFPLPLTDLSAIEGDRMNHAMEFLAAELCVPYDFSVEPLWKVRLVVLDHLNHILFLAVDHFIADDWAMDILIGELRVLYAAFSKGLPSPLEEPAFQFADYACWQRQMLQGERLQKLKDYWRDKLADFGLWPQVNLPFERIEKSGSSDVIAARQHLTIGETTTDSLKALSNRHKASLFVVLVAILVALLNRYTGRTKIGIPSTIANRSQLETRGIVGWLNHQLVFGFDLTKITTFEELLDHARNVVFDAYQHQDLPFSNFPGWTNTWSRTANYPAVRFNMKAQAARLSSADSGAIGKWSRLVIEPITLPQFSGRRSMMPGMSISVEERDGCLDLQVLYEAERYRETDIANFLKSFLDLTEFVLLSPRAQLSEAPMG